MSYIFGHKYRFYIGSPSRLVEYHNSPTDYDIPPNPNNKTPKQVSLLTGGVIDYRTIPEQAVVIENPFQMQAQVSYKIATSSANTPNLGKFTFYNLPTNTLAEIAVNKVVILQAGYDSQKTLPLIFSGTVESFKTERKGADMVTEIIAKEGGNVVNTVRVQVAYPRGTTYDLIFLDLMQKFADNGIPTGSFVDTDRARQVLESPLRYNDKLSTILTTVCDNFDYVWFIVKGRLFIQPKDLDRPTEFVILDPSQVIGNISSANDANGKGVADKNVPNKGVKYETYLNGEVSLNTYTRLPEGDFKGDYKTSEITYTLNWKNGPWKNTIKAGEVKEFG